MFIAELCDDDDDVDVQMRCFYALSSALVIADVCVVSVAGVRVGDFPFGRVSVTDVALPAC